MSKKTLWAILLVGGLLVYSVYLLILLYPYIGSTDLEIAWEMDFSDINVSNICIGDGDTVFVVSDSYGVIAINTVGKELYRFMPNQWSSYRIPAFSYELGEKDTLWIAYKDVVSESDLANTRNAQTIQIPLTDFTSTGEQTILQIRTLVTRLACFDTSGERLVDQIHDLDIDVWGSNLWWMAGKVYISNTHEDLFCFNRQGGLVWTKNFPSMLGSLKSESQLLLYCSKDCIGLSPDGNELWRDSKGWGLGFDSGKNWSSSEGSCCVLGSNGEFHIIDYDGQELWSRELSPTSSLSGKSNIFSPKPTSSNYGIPAVKMHHDGTVYALSSSAVITKYSPDGEILWHFTIGSSVNGFGLGVDGTVYLQSYDKGLIAVNANGKLLWRDERFKKSFLAPTVGSNGKLYLEQNDKLIAVIIPGCKSD